jgi:hypothetical protein
MPSSALMARMVSHIFGLDVRSLAVYRMGLASTMFYVLCVRATDLEAFYSDNGLATRGASIALSKGDHWNLSIHMLSGHAKIIAAVFAVHFAALVCMFVGYKTRRAAILCWLLEVSLSNRNNAVLQGGDVLCRCLHMYAIFLPMGQVWGLDAWLRARGPQRCAATHIRSVGGTASSSAAEATCAQRLTDFFSATSPAPSYYKNDKHGTVYSSHNLVCSMGTAAVILQLCLLYLFAGLSKYEDRSWTRDFNAVELSLHTDEFSTYVGMFLRKALPPSVLVFLTRCSHMIELWCPVLVLFPLSACNRRAGLLCKQSVIVLFFAFHIGIRVTLDIGHFSAASMCLWTLLIPSECYERRRKAAASLDHADPDFDPDPRRTQQWQTRRPPHRFYNASLSQLPLWMNVCVGLIMYCVFASNVASYFEWKDTMHYLPVGGLLSVMLQSMRIKQQWNMFSRPYANDGWYETTGLLRGNTTVDLMGWGGPVPRKLRFHIASDYLNPSLVPQAHYGKDRPVWFSRRFASQRWRKFVGTLRWDTNAKYRVGYGKYLCNAWNGAGYVANDRDLGQLVTFELRFHAEPTVCAEEKEEEEGEEEEDEADGRSATTTCQNSGETVLWNHRCF